VLDAAIELVAMVLVGIATVAEAMVTAETGVGVASGGGDGVIPVWRVGYVGFV